MDGTEENILTEVTQTQKINITFFFISSVDVSFESSNIVFTLEYQEHSGNF